MAQSGGVEVRASLQTIIPDRIREALLRRAAAHAVGIIRKRTLAGVDVAGVPFRPYSAEYKRLKTGSGRSGDVNLTLAGGMLAGMVILSVTPQQALIGFQGAPAGYRFKRLRKPHKTYAGGEMVTGAVTSRKLKDGRRQTHTLSRSTAAPPVANALKAAANDRGLGRNPRRHFFGLSEQERREVIAEAAKALRLR